MSPVRLGLLALAVVALFGAVWVVFIGPGPQTAAPTQLALATSGSSSAPVAIASGAEPSGALSSPAQSDAADASAGPSAVPSGSAILNPLAKTVPAHSLDPDQLTGYIWPVNHALITTHFAPEPPADGGFVMINGVAYHDGVDLATHCGDKVRAAHDGTVLYAGRDYDPYLGYEGDASAIYDRLQRLGRTNEQAIVIVVDDGDGYRSEYVHLEEADVQAGDVVQAGDPIGLEGETGFATGCHLHYSLIRMDGGWQPVVSYLLKYGYPPLVRERVNPLDVLPWGDPNAPQVLQDKVNPPTPTPLPSAPPSGEPSGEPSTEPSPGQTANPTGENQ